MLSSFLYWRALVPRLPRFHSVPFWWWLFIFSPVLVVFIGVPFAQPRQWFVSAFVSGLGVVAALFRSDWQNYRRGLPVAHDTFFGTAEHLSLFATRAVEILCIAIVLGWSAGLFRKKIHRHVSAA